MPESDVESIAVSVADLSFSYSKSDNQILNGIYLTVPKARIYGLLGPSGCGKTTLLKCILSRLKPNKGVIEIFGSRPGSESCHIPGASVGYMPQELGLYQDFNIEEILTYFGRIFAMKKTEIKDKINHLIKLLQLPKKNKLIGKISGGQQRRVSLACALIHCPPLLILDEPTVGTDPLLRQTIWYHLDSLCKSGLTIILTTHYIEEARQASIVAFMRTGKILAEDSPDLLLNFYGTTSLEEVFLKLCHLETNRNCDSILDKNSNFDNKSIEIELKDQNKKGKSFYETQLSVDELKNVEENHSNGDSSQTALLCNDNKCEIISDKVIANYDMTVDQSLVNINNSSLNSNISKVNNNCINTGIEVPLNSVYTTRDDRIYIKISGTQVDKNQLLSENTEDFHYFSQKLLPEKSEPIAQIRSSGFTHRISALLHKNFRRMSRNWGQLSFFVILPAVQLLLLLSSISSGPSELNLAIFDEELIRNKTNNNLGQLFLSCLDNQTFNLKYYDSYEAAYESVEMGESWALVDINERFSAALRLRQLYGSDADEDTIEESQIQVHIDWSNQAISIQIERYFYEAMMKFGERVAIASNINPESIKIPVVFETPIYGRRDESLRDFVLPGCYVLLVFFTTASVTAHLILDERKGGLLERSLVAGITAFEFLLSHALTQFLILCLQITLMLLISFLIFQREITNCLPLVIALALSQGFCGIVFGLMNSAICSDILFAAMFTICMFFVSIILGGVFWPIENMPTLLRMASNLMPSTLSIQSMRSILFRGWGLSYFQVYIGFIVTYVWFAFFVIIALIFLKRSF